MGTPFAANCSNGVWSLHFLQEDYVSTLSLERIGHLFLGFLLFVWELLALYLIQSKQNDKGFV